MPILPDGLTPISQIYTYSLIRVVLEDAVNVQKVLWLIRQFWLITDFLSVIREFHVISFPRNVLATVSGLLIFAKLQVHLSWKFEIS